MSTPLEDELTSINSIYGEETLVLQGRDSQICTLRLPSCASITLRIEFPKDYPDAPPAILGTHSVGNDAPKGAGRHLVDLTRQVLARVYQPGESCIYDIIEETGNVLENEAQNEPVNVKYGDRTATETTPQEPTIDLSHEPPWTVAPPLIEKKSIFLARAAPVTSPL